MFDGDPAVVLSDVSLALVDELRSIRESVKALKAREEVVRAAILTELVDCSEGLTAAGVPVVTIDRQVRTRVDGDRLQALYPDVWKDCQTETVVQTVRLPETV